jgi:hypothetical protein
VSAYLEQDFEVHALVFFRQGSPKGHTRRSPFVEAVSVASPTREGAAVPLDAAWPGPLLLRSGSAQFTAVWKGSSQNFACPQFSEVRSDGVRLSIRREEAIWAGVGQFDSSDWTICESVKSTI